MKTVSRLNIIMIFGSAQPVVHVSYVIIPFAAVRNEQNRHKREKGKMINMISFVRRAQACCRKGTRTQINGVEMSDALIVSG